MSRFIGVLVAAFLPAAMLFASAVAVMTGGDPPPPKSAAPAGASSKPMIIDNPDGTFTIQKEPLGGTSKDSKVQNGLVIPPQVVVPFASGIGKRP